MSAFPFPHKCTFLREIREVASGGRRGCAGDSVVLASAHPTLESLRPFLEHPKKCSLLPFVKFSTDAVKQLRLVDQEFDERERAPLRFDGCTGEPCQPLGDFVAFVGRFQGGIVARAPREYGCRERNERRLAQTLRKGFFR